MEDMSHPADTPQSSSISICQHQRKSQQRRRSRSNGPASNACDGGAGPALADSLGVELAPISPLELLNTAGCGDGDDLLPPDPPTVVINSDSSPPTEKQKRIARVVMCVAFVLLATCVILVAVTLSMSDHIDDLVRKSHFHGSFMRQQQRLPTANNEASLESNVGGGRNTTITLEMQSAH